MSKLVTSIPLANFLLATKPKWGFDFALDAVREEQLFEVLHVEFDSKNFDQFGNELIRFEYFVRHTDWVDAAERIWMYKHEWEGLSGFEQNNWKSKFLLGWNKSEYTEKTI